MCLSTNEPCTCAGPRSVLRSSGSGGPVKTSNTHEQIILSTRVDVKHFFTPHTHIQQPREVQADINDYKTLLKMSSCVYIKPYSMRTSSCHPHAGCTLGAFSSSLCDPCAVLLSHIGNAGEMRGNIF